jgi:hypothetical protein
MREPCLLATRDHTLPRRTRFAPRAAASVAFAWLSLSLIVGLPTRAVCQNKSTPPAATPPAQQTKTSNDATKAKTSKSARTAQRSEPTPPKSSAAAQTQLNDRDAAVVRQLELLMLLDIMKDYELFHGDPKPTDKSRAKP